MTSTGSPSRRGDDSGVSNRLHLPTVAGAASDLIVARWTSRTCSSHRLPVSPRASGAGAPVVARSVEARTASFNRGRSRYRFPAVRRRRRRAPRLRSVGSRPRSPRRSAASRRRGLLRNRTPRRNTGSAGLWIPAWRAMAVAKGWGSAMGNRQVHEPRFRGSGTATRPKLFSALDAIIRYGLCLPSPFSLASLCRRSASGQRCRGIDHACAVRP